MVAFAEVNNEIQTLYVLFSYILRFSEIKSNFYDIVTDILIIHDAWFSLIQCSSVIIRPLNYISRNINIRILPHPLLGGLRGGKKSRNCFILTVGQSSINSFATQSTICCSTRAPAYPTERLMTLTQQISLSCGALNNACPLAFM